MAYRERDRDRDRDRYERPEGFRHRKPAPFLDSDIKDIDFKDARFLSRFTSERGKILPRRITGLSSQQQKKIATAVKRARQMSLLPFINYGGN